MSIKYLSCLKLHLSFKFWYSVLHLISPSEYLADISISIFTKRNYFRHNFFLLISFHEACLPFSFYFSWCQNMQQLQSFTLSIVICLLVKFNLYFIVCHTTYLVIRSLTIVQSSFPHIREMMLFIVHALKCKANFPFVFNFHFIHLAFWESFSNPLKPKSVNLPKNATGT